MKVNAYSSLLRELFVHMRACENNDTLYIYIHLNRCRTGLLQYKELDKQSTQSPIDLYTK